MMFDEQSRPDAPANESEEGVPQLETTSKSQSTPARDETPEQRDRRMSAGGMAAVAGSSGAGLGLGAGVGAVGSREAIDHLLDDDDEDSAAEDEGSAAELDVFNDEVERAVESEEQVQQDVLGAARITDAAPPASDRSSVRGADDAAIITSEAPITPEGGVGSGVRRPDFSGSPIGGEVPESPDGSEVPAVLPTPDVPDAPVFDFPEAPEPPEPPSGFAPPFPDFGPGPSAEPPLPDFPSPPDFPATPEFESPPLPPDLPSPPPAAAGPTAPAGPAEAPQPELPVTGPPATGDPPTVDVPVAPAPTIPAALPASGAPPNTDEPTIPTDQPEAPDEGPSAATDDDASNIDAPVAPDVPSIPETPDTASPPDEEPGDVPDARPPWGPSDEAGNDHATQPDDDPPPHEDPGYDEEPPPNGAHPPVDDEEGGVLPAETPAYFEYGGVQFDNPEAAGYDLINVNGSLHEYIHPETGDYISVLVNSDGTYTVWVRGDEQPGDFEMEFTVDANGNYQGTGGAWYDEVNAQDVSILPTFPAEDGAQNEEAAPDQPEEPAQEDETASPPDEPEPPLLPDWLPASFTYDGITWPSPAGGGFTHQASHDGNEYFANEQYSVVVHDNGDGSGVILIDDRNVGQSWDMGFTFYSDGSYVPLDAYIPEEEPLEFDTTSTEVSEEAPSDDTSAEEPSEGTAETESDPVDDRDLVTTTDPTTTGTDASDDIPPVEERSLHADETTFEDESDMDDDV